MYVQALCASTQEKIKWITIHETGTECANKWEDVPLLICKTRTVAILAVYSDTQLPANQGGRGNAFIIYSLLLRLSWSLIAGVLLLASLPALAGTRHPKLLPSNTDSLILWATQCTFWEATLTYNKGLWSAGSRHTWVGPCKHSAMFNSTNTEISEARKLKDHP